MKTKPVFEQFEMDNLRHLGAIEQISQWSAESSTMKFYTPDYLREHPLSVLAFAEETEGLLGHVAITEITQTDQGQIARIGAFAVNRDFQQNGVGAGLIKHILKLAPKSLPEVVKYSAYVHKLSQKPFLENGAKEIGPRIPPAKTGCNTIVSIGAATGANHGHL